jgi:two-component system sensor histidine kinase BaeS
MRNRQRPPWWPEGEPWPPEGEFPWRRLRRRFFIRFAIGVTLFLAFLFAGPIIVVGTLLGLTGVSGPAAIVGSIAILLFVIVLVTGAARSARRFAIPAGALIEATGRLEAGDYSARVPEYYHGPRELRAMIAAFNSMAARLEDDERQRRTLLADVSHELRTPLAVLQGELEAMIDGVHPTDQVHLEAAVEEIRMLTGLVEDLRTLTLAEAGTLTIHREPTDLVVLAQEVAQGFDSIGSAQKVTVKVEWAADLPLADIDPLRIRQVLSNLIANAVRYAPAESEVIVAISLLEAPHRVAFAVTDHGPGISPDVLPHLFDRFAKSPESRGSGLGLAIARRLVEAHGGTITALRPDGGGTTIRFEVPVGPV